ncbi:MAG: hypothetical protein AB1779_02590 [Candidatus Thermoplasmatota archaeon]
MERLIKRRKRIEKKKKALVRMELEETKGFAKQGRRGWRIVEPKREVIAYRVK